MDYDLGLVHLIPRIWGMFVPQHSRPILTDAGDFINTQLLSRLVHLGFSWCSLKIPGGESI